MIRYDAVVVGARPAGAGTALHLARGGCSVLVLDRAPALGDTLSTHALLRGGVLQLARWGLLDRVVAAGTPPVRRSTYHLAHGDIPITIKPAAGVDAFYAPRRAVLDRIVLDGAAEAGATVRLGVRVADVLRHRGRVVGVVAVDEHGRRVDIGADIVVGADGRGSAVADAVGAPVERRGASSSAVTYGYVGGLDVDGYRWWFRGGRSAGAIPTNDGDVCVFVAGPPGDPTGPTPAATLLGGLATTAPELAEPVAAAPSGVRGVRTFAGQRGYLRKPWGDGWALVGDAGYLKDPITAHGITDALRDAELLARAILDGGDDAPRRARALAGFAHLRDRLSTPLFEVGDELASHRWTDDTVGDVLLRLSSAMADEVETLLALDVAAA
jgi:flavin-dependent dehydrogenase